MEPELISECVGRNRLGVRINLYKCGFCGNEFKTSAGNIKHGVTKSCGCLKKGRKPKPRDHKSKVAVEEKRGRPRKDYLKEDLQWPTLIATDVCVDNSGDLLSVFECSYCQKFFLSNRRKIALSSLKSCGCKRGVFSKTHGGTGTRLFRIWMGMKNRCNPNTKNPRNVHYSGRGISVCKEWQDFSAFQEWSLENGYQDNLSIDRIDNDGDYCPENCRWATAHEQSLNKRNTVWTIPIARTAKRMVEAGFSHRETCRILGLPGYVARDIRRILNGERILLDHEQ